MIRSDVLKMTSVDLINLLAKMGYGKPYDPLGDIRKASVIETGTFTQTGRSYAKIVVQADDTSMYDYGVRLWISN
jgi:hypothetical protein